MSFANSTDSKSVKSEDIVRISAVEGSKYHGAGIVAVFSSSVRLAISRNFEVMWWLVEEEVRFDVVLQELITIEGLRRKKKEKHGKMKNIEEGRKKMNRYRKLVFSAFL